MIKKITIILLLIVPFSFASVNAVGQDFKNLKTMTENAVKLKLPGTKLSHKSEYDKAVTYMWGDQKGGIGISIFYGGSSKEAFEKMNFKNKILSTGPGEKISGLGDERYLSVDENTNLIHIRFRKNNVYVELTSPSKTLVRQLASRIASEIS